MAKRKKLHWTQKPENRDKVLAMTQRGSTTKNVKRRQVATGPTAPLLDELLAVQRKIAVRVDEIDAQILELEKERHMLKDLRVAGQGDDSDRRHASGG